MQQKSRLASVRAPYDGPSRGAALGSGGDASRPCCGSSPEAAGAGACQRGCGCSCFSCCCSCCCWGWLPSKSPAGLLAASSAAVVCCSCFCSGCSCCCTGGVASVGASPSACKPSWLDSPLALAVSTCPTACSASAGAGSTGCDAPAAAATSSAASCSAGGINSVAGTPGCRGPGPDSCRGGADAWARAALAAAADAAGPSRNRCSKT